MHSTSLHSDIVKKIIPIVYEDDAICIVNKPYGLSVQGGAQVSTCLIDILKVQLGTDIFPVHRLDKETAGLLITAKTAAAARSCRELFDSQTVQKEYLAFCFRSSKSTGELSGTVVTPIKENGIEKPASTTYRIIAGGEDYCLFSAIPHTGRMHQIRIHLAGIGYPLIGDDKHGDFRLNKALWKSARIKKLQLCAFRLQLPIRGRPRRFTVPIPEHIRSALMALLEDTGIIQQLETY